MDTRLNMFENPVSGKFLRRFTAAARVYEDTLPTALLELVSLRISQINGCGFCTDMHTKELAHHGESAVRINLVAAWREANCYTDAERAAFELAEQGTRVADAHGGVPDQVWDDAADHFSEDELAALVSLIAFMNTVNRINIITQQPAGDYEVGWLDKVG